jgi:hypothetical protein
MYTASSFYARQMELKKEEPKVEAMAVRHHKGKTPAKVVEKKPLSKVYCNTILTLQLPTFKPMGEDSDLADVRLPSPTGGIMNLPEAREHKWDPSKNFPSRDKPVRPKGTLGEKFGPSESEMQVLIFYFMFFTHFTRCIFHLKKNYFLPTRM